MEENHKRRVRYKGTHPRKFDEKYKEHQPEKYGDTVKRVIEKGSTPAGMHISICVEEILEFLQIQKGMKGLDATLGYGGHSTKMLECLSGEGHLYALDIDPIEREKTKDRLKSRGFTDNVLTVLGRNFGELKSIAEEYGKFDFILADLGVSSMQIDNPERGFSFKTDAPLDLRMNPTEGISAAKRLEEVSLAELEGMLVVNSDEPYAKEIARAILNKRKKGNAVSTTKQLKETIEEALNFLPAKEKKEVIRKSCQRTFQALRIDVNNEFEVLEAFLEALPDALNENGKVAILTFHSGEDRLVKKMMKQHYLDGKYQSIAKDVVRPSKEECNINTRAKCTKMRWGIR